MRKEGLENIVHTGHNESKRSRLKERVNYLTRKENDGKAEMLFRAIKDRM